MKFKKLFLLYFVFFLSFNLGYSMSGSGTELDPYLVTDCIDLQNVQLSLSSYYELGNDIDCSDTVNWNGGNGFIPIDAFAGVLDGSFFTISDLYINRPLADNIGLFGTKTNLKNVKLINVNITGDRYVGALVGKSIGSIISNVSVTGIVTCPNDQCGGLVGQSHDGEVIILSSSFIGTVNGEHSNRVGGLLADAKNPGDLINNSYFIGTIIGEDDTGGLVGNLDDGIIQNSYVKSNISGSGFVGGVTGSCRALVVIQNVYSISNIYNGGLYSGNIVGNNDYGNITNSYYYDVPGDDATTTGCTSGCTEEADYTNFYDKTHNVYDSVAPYWDFDNIWSEQSGDYPVLRWSLDPICSPPINQDWLISDEQICDAKEVDLGTGIIKILNGGSLNLVNSAIISSSGIQLERSGDSVFINQGSKLQLN